MANIIKKRPLVSVVIPIHDRFDLVNETINSVINQTYRPIELILIDDDSTIPFFPKISSQLGIEVITKRHEKNRGPGASRETGRQVANGDYLAYLDSDDLWHPAFLDKMFGMLKNNPEIGICYCKTAHFNGIDLNSATLRRRNDQSFDSILPTLFFGRPWSTGACLWTRWATDKIGPWFDGWTYEDIEYELRAGIYGIQISHLPELLCFERETEDPQQLSHISNKKAVLQKFFSVKAMALTVLKNKHTLLETTTNLFLKKIMRPLATELFQEKEYKKVIEICKLMIKIAKPLSTKWLVSVILLVAVIFRKIPGAIQLFHISSRLLY